MYYHKLSGQIGNQQKLAFFLKKFKIVYYFSVHLLLNTIIGSLTKHYYNSECNCQREFLEFALQDKKEETWL